MLTRMIRSEPSIGAMIGEAPRVAGDVLMHELDHANRRSRAGGQGAGNLVAEFDRGAAGRDVFTIRDLTKELGVSARTLRFYEEKGLVDPRRRGQERLYSR